VVVGVGVTHVFGSINRLKVHSGRHNKVHSGAGGPQGKYDGAGGPQGKYDAGGGPQGKYAGGGPQGKYAGSRYTTAPVDDRPTRCMPSSMPLSSSTAAQIRTVSPQMSRRKELRSATEVKCDSGEPCGDAGPGDEEQVDSAADSMVVLFWPPPGCRG
jgi:hypothetical protein